MKKPELFKIPNTGRHLLNGVLLIFIAGMFSQFPGCGKIKFCPGDKEPSARQAVFGFDLIDSLTQEPLIGLFGKYREEEVDVLLEDGTQVRNLNVSSSGSVSFKLFKTIPDASALTEKQELYFFLHLGEKERDTIQVNYLTYFNEDPCHEQTELREADIYFNDSLYISISIEDLGIKNLHTLFVEFYK